ncbi:MAG: deaminase, partial [Verrucomicrobia bacterium]|nr:deaminase [Verrucomicrobiota bacterium]
HHPFGAVLVAPDNKTVLMKQPNVEVVRHAETELAGRAAGEYERSLLWNCTLVTTIEPCLMCAGTQILKPETIYLMVDIPFAIHCLASKRRQD